MFHVTCPPSGADNPHTLFSFLLFCFVSIYIQKASRAEKDQQRNGSGTRQGVLPILVQTNKK